MLAPLSHMETPFPEKFGIPRQPLLIKEAWGRMRFPKNDFYAEAFRGINNHSHLWVIFQFSAVPEEEVKALVRPPRFQGREKLGVFATRSPHRPNRLGLSVVEFNRMEETKNEIILHVRGVDLMNGTPVFDIKPYVPYVDAVEGAKSLFSEAPTFYSVEWRCEAPEEKVLIEKVIGLDPRPGQSKESEEEFGVSLAGWNVRFKKSGDVFLILKINKG
jgi:tRNA (adenine37-N6)-methyltransferase